MTKNGEKTQDPVEMDERLREQTRRAYEEQQAIERELAPLAERVHALQMRKRQMWAARVALAQRRLLGKTVTDNFLNRPTSRRTGVVAWVDARGHKCGVDFGGGLGIVTLECSCLTTADRDVWCRMMAGEE
jgi:hypothetical protein